MNTTIVGNLLLTDTVLSTVDLDGKYNKTGGDISGDVSILSGKFSGGINSIATGETSFAYGNNVSAIGKDSYATGISSIAGCYGWYYDHIDYANNAFYLTLTQPNVIHTSSLTGAGTINTSFNSGFAKGDIISYVNKSKFDMELSVAAVNGNKITVQPFKNTGKYKLDETSPNHDDWSIFCVNKPIAGKVWFGETAYAEGLSCRAINSCSHTEGKQNLAYGQYSHVEGYKNRAAYAAHAEGKGNGADGQYSHVEGWNNRTSADCSHAEGCYVSALNKYAHAEGLSTIASGLQSHAGGYQTSAFGTNTIALGNKSYANGYCAFACGDSVSALTSEAFAIGWKNTASGQYSFAGGHDSEAKGNQSIAFGNHATTNGGSAISFGYMTAAEKDNTFAFGLNAKANDNESFVWSGQSSSTNYESHGQGTFNINPKDGQISNVYIGQYNFIQNVLIALQSMLTNSTQKAALKSALRTALDMS